MGVEASLGGAAAQSPTLARRGRPGGVPASRGSQRAFGALHNTHKLDSTRHRIATPSRGFGQVRCREGGEGWTTNFGVF